MKPNILVTAIIVLSSTLACWANTFYKVESGDQPNHLTPIHYPEDYYDKLINEHLLLTDYSFGLFISRPSFSAESCLCVHAEISEESIKKHGAWYRVPDHEKKYLLTLTRPTENLHAWFMENNKKSEKSKFEVEKIDREISLELAIQIQRSWAKMLQHTKYPAKSSGGLDGTTCYFSVWVKGLGYLYGETRSHENGLPGEMISIGHELEKLTINKEAKEQPLIEHLLCFEAKISNIK